MRILLILIIAIHTFVDKIKAFFKPPEPMNEENPSITIENERGETISDDQSNESTKSDEYIVAKDSIIGAKIIFISSFAMMVSMLISFQFILNSPFREKNRTIFLIDDYFAPLWQSCNLAFCLYLGNQNIGRYVRQCITMKW